MKRITGVLLIALLAPAMAVAGEFYGTVTEAGKPVVGVKMEIASGGRTYPIETDKDGAYRVVVRETGKCTVKVTYKDKTSTVDVNSFDSSVRYNLALEEKDGKLTVTVK